jgi:hypothetical protein
MNLPLRCVGAAVTERITPIKATNKVTIVTALMLTIFSDFC